MTRPCMHISPSMEAHDDAMLMVPPPGFKFIPRYETVCGKPGCFECFDIYCDRCESKDRRIVELELRNNDLVKYITQLQSRVFGRSASPQTAGGATIPSATLGPSSGGGSGPGGGGGDVPLSGAVAPTSSSSPFAYIQSPVLYDPNMNLSYVATTTFAPAPHDVPLPRKT